METIRRLLQHQREYDGLGMGLQMVSPEMEEL